MEWCEIQTRDLEKYWAYNQTKLSGIYQMENLNWFTTTLLIILLVLVYRGLHFLYWLFFQGNIRLLFEAPSAEDMQRIEANNAKRQADKEARLLKKHKARAISIENEKKSKKPQKQAYV